MQIVTQEMAERILRLVETGSSSINTQFAEVFDELVKYMIFVESMSVAKFLLGFLFVGLVWRSFGMFVKSAETEKDVFNIKGWRNLITGSITLITLYMSYSSVLNLGKVIFAPKIYMIEMAIEKVKEIKAAQPGK